MPIIGVLPSDYAPPILVEYLVIAGGGAGAAGGGGAGGLISNIGSPIEIERSFTNTVVVGAGGASLSNGSKSVFNSYIAYGGGAGGLETQNGFSGGSGGGGGFTGLGGSAISGQGNPGGPGSGDFYAAGGGGGDGRRGGGGAHPIRFGHPRHCISALRLPAPG